MFSPENAHLARPVFTSRSVDEGETWLPPAPIQLDLSHRVGVSTRPFAAADGSLKLPFEYRSEFGVQAIALLSSNDDGYTWTAPTIVAHDPAGRLNLCDARFEVLADGRIIALLWTFLNESEETVEVRSVFSPDHGQTWSTPEPIGLVSQITAPLLLPSGALIAAANYRLASVGIRLWCSLDCGETWLSDDPIQLWDPSAGRVCGIPVERGAESESARSKGVWDELQRFSFGTPDLVSLGDHEVLHTYYATLNDIVHVRGCLFRVHSEGFPL